MAKRDKGPCKECNGSGTITTRDDKGEYERTCPRCNGSGKES